jgi:hypothetical protein
MGECDALLHEFDRLEAQIFDSPSASVINQQNCLELGLYDEIFANIRLESQLLKFFK